MSSLTDKHFEYNELINSALMKQDYNRVKEICFQEIDEFPRIGKALRRELYGLPPSIPCRDDLLHIVLHIEKNFDEAEKLLDLFVQKELFTRAEKEVELKKIQIRRLYFNGIAQLNNKNFEDAKSILNQIIVIDKSEAGEVYKLLGDYLIENNNEQEALNYYKKTIEVNPLISGVKRKLKSLSKKLGVSTEQNIDATIKILKEKETVVTESWEKLEIVRAYTKIKQYDNAWRLLNEIMISTANQANYKSDIYIEMAKVLYAEQKFKNALFHYLLAYRDRYILGFPIPEKKLTQGIESCLKKSNLNTITADDIYKIARDNTASLYPSGNTEFTTEYFEQRDKNLATNKDLNPIKEAFEKLFN